MEGNGRMWKAELAELSDNPNFLGVFLDDLTFHVWDDSQTAPQLKDESETRVEAPAISLPPELSTKEDAAINEGSSSLSLEAERIEPKVASHDGKVVVLIPAPLEPNSRLLLEKILAAVGLRLNDVFLLEETYAAKSLVKFANAKIVLSFGAVLDFQPDHQLRSKTITIIMAKDLANLEHDAISKKQLWESMRRFFS